jgi:hypothetical protein
VRRSRAISREPDASDARRRKLEGSTAARARFPDLLPQLAVRLAQRFPDDDAVRAADDAELLSMRHMGPQQFRKLRARYPQSSGEDG